MTVDVLQAQHTLRNTHPMTATRPSRGSQPDRATSATLITELEHALVSDRLNVLIASDDAAMRDTCAKGLLERLRSRHAAQISVLFEMNRELILERFNALVDALPVEQARAEPADDARPQFWLLQVQSPDSEEQARLLMRLTQDFPGAGLRLILVAPPRSVEALVNAPGGRHLLVSQWSGKDHASAVASQEAPPPRRDSTKASGRSARAAVRRSPSTSGPPETPRRKPSGLSGARLALILFAALLVAIAIGLGLHLRAG
jgi:hypothetical protein